MIVDLFIPCFIDQMFPNIGWSVVKILESKNVEVSYNPKQTCCGQPTFNSGYWKQSKKAAIKFFKDFPNDRPIVVPSASCAGYVKNHYTKLFEDDAQYLPECERLNRNVIEFTDFLVNHLKINDLNASFPHKVTYHDACSALREYGLSDEPRQLLANVNGLELIEMEDRHTCCGFGGTFMVKFVSISTAMAEQKVQNALNTGARYIVSTEASCLMNIQSYINKQKLPIKTIHLAEILAGGL
ncbi:(Fe-S)-binding protein [Saccharicrinis sp. GN24d3]|uniref:(Fe-S)-binding protein n=1 Tax=Saccharicrinis sp. GN24d3 TaxID=3458416 RepID=UPI0040375D5D